MNSLQLSQNPGQIKNNFRKKYHVDIKAMFWNGSRSYHSLLKPPSKKKKEILNYQEYWSSENCNFKGCPFRVTKFLLLNIKLVKHWIMVIIISVSDEVLGSGSSFLPSWKEKKTVMKKFGQFCLSGIWWGEFSSCKCNFDFDIL